MHAGEMVVLVHSEQSGDGVQISSFLVTHLTPTPGQEKGWWLGFGWEEVTSGFL